MNLNEQINKMRHLSGQEPLDEGWLKNTAMAGLAAASMLGGPKADAQSTKVPTQTQIQAQKAGADDVRQLTDDERYQWNQFYEFVKKSGYQDSPELDVRDKNLGQKLFQQFKAQNSNITIDYSIVKSVQAEMQKAQELNADFVERHGDSATAENIRKWISKVDGWFGSKTSHFPFTYQVTKHPDGYVEDNGLIRGDGSLTGSRNKQAAVAGSDAQRPKVINGMKVIAWDKNEHGKWMWQSEDEDWHLYTGQ